MIQNAFENRLGAGLV